MAKNAWLGKTFSKNSVSKPQPIRAGAIPANLTAARALRTLITPSSIPSGKKSSTVGLAKFVGNFKK